MGLIDRHSPLMLHPTGCHEYQKQGRPCRPVCIAFSILTSDRDGATQTAPSPQAMRSSIDTWQGQDDLQAARPVA